MPRKPEGRIIERTARDGTLRFIVRWGRQYGKTFDTRTEAEEQLKVRRERAAGKQLRTITTLGPSYIAHLAECERLRRGHSYYTERNVKRFWELRIASAPFANKRVDTITRSEVQRYLASLVGKPVMRSVLKAGQGRQLRPTGKRVGAPTIKLVQIYLRGFFRWCELDVNPATDVRLPNTKPIAVKVERDTRPHLHLDEIERLFGLPLKVFNRKMRAVYAFGIFAGLRPGEIAGLRWEHIHDLDGREPEIHVRASYDSSTKTQGSQRELPMLPQLVRELRAYRDSLPVRPITGLVFKSKRTHGMHARSWSAGWRKERGRGFSELAGVRPHIEWRHMRHSLATHLWSGAFTGGRPWPIERVSQLLGHDEIATTLKHYASRDVSLLHKELRLSAVNDATE